MEFSLNLSSIFTLLGAVQTSLLAGALLGLKRGYQSANRTFAAFLIVISIILFGNILTNTRYFLVFPHLAQICTPLQFLPAPLFYFYIRSLIFRRPVWEKWSFAHFLPFAACLLHLTPFYLQSAEYKANYLTSALEHFPLDWGIRTGLAFAQQFVYLILLFSMLARYSPEIKGENKSIKRVNLFWVKGLIIAFTIIWVINITRSFFAFQIETNFIAPLLITLLVYIIAFLALKNSEVIVGISDEDIKRRYEKSALSPDKAEKHLKKLLQIMGIEKPYLENDLSVQKLAVRLSVSPQHLSQVINEKLNQNFADFINSYRVEETKHRLTDPSNKHLSIEAIAERCGFNSKSAFNSAFKKHVNMTPSQFRRTVKPNDEQSNSFS